MMLSLVKSPGHKLDDEQWKIVVSNLPQSYQSRIVNDTLDYRAYVEAVLWVVDNNAPWTGIPHEYGSWRAIYVRFLRWVEAEHWIAVERALGFDSRLAGALRDRVERYRASHHWRNKGARRRVSGRVTEGDFEAELAGRWAACANAS